MLGVGGRTGGNIGIEWFPWQWLCPHFWLRLQHSDLRNANTVLCS